MQRPSDGRSTVLAYLPLLLAVLAVAQLPCAGQEESDATEPQTPSRHILGIIPNFRTTPTLQEYRLIEPGEKFKIAEQDTFDRGNVALAALFAGEGQLTNSNSSFGQGVQGYAHYWGTGFADIAIGNYMTEAIFPTFLHQDPRYFRRGSGGVWSRLGYAAKQIVWTRTDSGGAEFNYSEFAGNSTAVAASMAYYPQDRSASSAVSKLGIQIGLDLAGNILKEFWPNRQPKSSDKRSANGR